MPRKEVSRRSRERATQRGFQTLKFVDAMAVQDAVPSLLRSESASPPLQPSRIGGHRFLSSLGDLKAGTTLEQKLHAAAQRQTLLRDLEEQV